MLNCLANILVGISLLCAAKASEEARAVQKTTATRVPLLHRLILKHIAFKQPHLLLTGAQQGGILESDADALGGVAMCIYNALVDGVTSPLEEQDNAMWKPVSMLLKTMHRKGADGEAIPVYIDVWNIPSQLSQLLDLPASIAPATDSCYASKTVRQVFDTMCPLELLSLFLSDRGQHLSPLICYSMQIVYFSLLTMPEEKRADSASSILNRGEYYGQCIAKLAEIYERLIEVRTETPTPREHKEYFGWRFVEIVRAKTFLRQQSHRAIEELFSDNLDDLRILVGSLERHTRTKGQASLSLQTGSNEKEQLRASSLALQAALRAFLSNSFSMDRAMKMHICYDLETFKAALDPLKDLGHSRLLHQLKNRNLAVFFQDRLLTGHVWFEHGLSQLLTLNLDRYFAVYYDSAEPGPTTIYDGSLAFQHFSFLWKLIAFSSNEFPDEASNALICGASNEGPDAIVALSSQQDTFDLYSYATWNWGPLFAKRCRGLAKQSGRRLVIRVQGMWELRDMKGIMSWASSYAAFSNTLAQHAQLISGTETIFPVDKDLKAEAQTMSSLKKRSLVCSKTRALLSKMSLIHVPACGFSQYGAQQQHRLIVVQKAAFIESTAGIRPLLVMTPFAMLATEYDNRHGKPLESNVQSGGSIVDLSPLVSGRKRSNWKWQLTLTGEDDMGMLVLDDNWELLFHGQCATGQDQSIALFLDGFCQMPRVIVVGKRDMGALWSQMMLFSEPLPVPDPGESLESPCARTRERIVRRRRLIWPSILERSLNVHQFRLVSVGDDQ